MESEEKLILLGEFDETKYQKDFTIITVQQKKELKFFVAFKSSIIELPFPDGFEKNDHHPSKDIIDQTTHHFTFLSADAGYGKSAFCESLFQKWIKDEYAGNWFIKIKLPEFNTIEKETEKETETVAKYLKPLAKYLKLTPWKLNCLEIDMKQSNKVTFLLDGLDEV